MMENKTRILAFIGSYADRKDSGIYSCEYNVESGSIEVIGQAAGLQNPTFLDVSVEKLKLYALTEATDADNQRIGAAASFDIEPSTGKLTFVNEAVTVPAPTCHITLDRTNKCIIVSSYHGGMIGLSPLMEDGRIGEISDIRQHEGSSLLPVQDQPRAHSVFIDPGNQFACACDLGLDRIFIYRLDVEAGKLIPHREVQVTPGSGPRHFAFHPSLARGYVINELNGTVTAFSFDREQGELTEIQTISTLPETYAGDNACADIHLSPDGLFLYGSNRGHDSIVVYAVDQQTGMLELVEFASTLGGHPRSFAISPDGRFLLAANRDSNSIVTFARDAQTGRLQSTGSELKLSKPVRIMFARLG